MPPAPWISIRIELVSGSGEQFWPRPGRTMVASSQHTFAHLADAINAAFARWDLAHLWSFDLADGSRIAEPDPWGEMETDHAPTRQLGTLAAGEQFVFEFDFGDSWLHLCTVKKTGLRPSEILGITPKAPIAIFGWGDLPDQHRRRWLDDDGSGLEQPSPNPGFADLPPIGMFAHLRRYDPPIEDTPAPPPDDTIPTTPDLRLVPPLESSGPALPAPRATPESTSSLHAALRLDDAVEAFLADQSTKVKPATLDRHAYALEHVQHNDRTVASLEAVVHELFDNLRVHGPRGAGANEVRQLGVSIRKMAGWAAQHHLIESESAERIAERTKTTGTELAAAARFDDALGQVILMNEVQRRFDGSADQPDQEHADTTWVIAEVNESSLRLTAFLDELEPIEVDLPGYVTETAQTGWMFTATAACRGGRWTLHELGTVYI